MRAYIDTIPCRQCGAPVQISVRPPLKVSSVLDFWFRDLGGKCRTCLQNAGENNKEVPREGNR